MTPTLKTKKVGFQQLPPKETLLIQKKTPSDLRDLIQSAQSGSEDINVMTTMGDEDDKDEAKKRGENQGGQDAEGLASMLYFYKELKYKCSVESDEESQENYKFHKKYLSKIKLLFLFVYIAVNPVLDTPNWCL